MGILDSVLAYKKEKEAQESADLQAIPQALAAFQVGRQQAQKSYLDDLTTQMQLQKFGIDAQKAPYELAKLQGDVAKVPFESKKLQAETEKAQAESGILNKFMSGDMGSSGGVITGGNIGGFQFERPDVKANILTQQEDIKNTAKAREAIDTYSSNAIEALNAIDKIEKKAESLGNFKRGAVSQAIEKSKMAMKEFSEDKAVNEFKQAIAQEMAPLVRKLAEEKGPLTDKDIERAMEGVGGKLTRPLADKKVALADLREKVKSAIIAKAQAAKLSDTDIKERYPDLYNKAFGKFKAGDTRVKGNITYVRQEDGTWLPKS